MAPQAKDTTAHTIELGEVSSTSSQDHPSPNQDRDVVRSYTTSQQMRSWDAFWYTINNTIGPGIFSVTSGIFAITGSVGITLALFLVGAILVACSLCVALEFGMAIPRSGGEKNYLERVFRRPKGLMTCIIAVLFVGLGGSAMVAIAFGSYVCLAAGRPNPAGSWETRFIAVGSVTFAALVHALFPACGVHFLRAFGILKIAIMVLIVCAGFAALAGRRLVPDPHNFDHIFAVQSGPGYGQMGLFGYGSAAIRTLYCYMGVASITAVLGEMKNPARTMVRVMPAALGVVTILYTLVNIAYFAAIPKAQMAKSDVIVAGIFFANVFGQSAAAKVLPALVACSCLGTILSSSFAHGRVNQEIAKEGILPWSHFWASNKPFGAPAPALFLWWLATIIMILAPPPGPAFTFILDLLIFPHVILGTLCVCGLLYLRINKSEKWDPPYTCPLVLLLLCIALHAVLLVAPLLPTKNGKNAQGYPYYTFPLAGLSVFVVGFVYWLCWSKLVPYFGGYRIESKRTVNEEGREVVEYHRIPIR